MHEVLVNRLGGLSLPRKSVVRLTDRPDMTLDVYRGRKTTIQQYNKAIYKIICAFDADKTGLASKTKPTCYNEQPTRYNEKPTRNNAKPTCNNEKPTRNMRPMGHKAHQSSSSITCFRDWHGD